MKLSDNAFVIILVLWAILSGLLLLQIADLQNQNNDLKRQTIEYPNQIEQLENYIDELENQTSELEDQIEELENQIQDLEEQVFLKSSGYRNYGGRVVSWKSCLRV